MGKLTIRTASVLTRSFRPPPVPALLALLLLLAPGCGGSSAGPAAPSATPGYPPQPIASTTPPSPPATDAPAATNGIGGVIISQGIQDTTGKVPLVAGRNATVRVFLAAPAANAQARPTVNIALWDASGNQVLNQNVPAPGQTIPAAPQLGTFSDTWNLDLPGALIQPGATFLASIVADAQGLTQLTWPATGQPLHLNVALAGNALRLTLVPVTTRATPGGPAVTGQVTSPTMALADWTANLARWFPVGSAAASIDLQVAPAWDPGLTYAAATDRTDAQTLRKALERMRKATPGSAFRYYAGVFVMPQGGTLLGQGEIGFPGLDLAKSFIVLDRYTGSNPYNDSQSVLVHELGHCLGRYHAPCAAPAADPAYPYPQGTLGTWGLDPATHLIEDPRLNRDVMGYCTPFWVSDYTYKGVLDAFAADQAGLASLNAAATDAVLVTGRISADGTASLDPFLDVQDLPGEPDPGPCTLNLYDAQGNTLATVSFGLEGETEGGPSDAFCFEVDLTPSQEALLDSATVTTPAGAVLQQLSRSAGRAVREPVAVPWKGGVHLGWDCAVHPEVMVRDPRTGAIIATAHDGAVDLATDAAELELIMLDGIHTRTRRVRVTR